MATPNLLHYSLGMRLRWIRSPDSSQKTKQGKVDVSFISPFSTSRILNIFNVPLLFFLCRSRVFLMFWGQSFLFFLLFCSRPAPDISETLLQSPPLSCISSLFLWVDIFPEIYKCAQVFLTLWSTALSLHHSTCHCCHFLTTHSFLHPCAIWFPPPFLYGNCSSDFSSSILITKLNVFMAQRKHQERRGLPTRLV